MHSSQKLIDSWRVLLLIETAHSAIVIVIEIDSRIETAIATATATGIRNWNSKLKFSCGTFKWQLPLLLLASFTSS